MITLRHRFKFISILFYISVNKFLKRRDIHYGGSQIGSQVVRMDWPTVE